MAIELRVPLAATSTVAWKNTTKQVYLSGQMIKLQDIVGVFVDDVGEQGTAISSSFPNGDSGVLVYIAEKIVLPVVIGYSKETKLGDYLMYIDVHNKVAPAKHFYGATHKICAVALEDADEKTETVLAHLLLLAS